MRNYFKIKNQGKKIRGKLDKEINNEVTGVANLIKQKNKGDEKNIEILEKTDGTITRSEKEIEETIAKFYQELFSLQNNNPEKKTQILGKIKPVITLEENKLLTAAINQEEVLLAISTFKENKSP